MNGFTLDPTIGEWCLSHKDIKIPAGHKTYSVNQAGYAKYPEWVQQYIDECMEDKFSMRYIGAMVGDVHRILIRGGIFFYPALKKNPKGKLRLLFECNPMSFLIEQAGGMSTTGTERVMELQPTELHERCPIFLGSSDLVERVQELAQKATASVN